MYKWQPNEDPDPDLRINENNKSEDAVPYEVGEPFVVDDVEIDNRDSKPKNAMAKRFTELITQGYKPHEAAKLIGSTMRGLVGNDQFKKQVQQLIETASLVPEMRKEMIRSGLNHIFISNINNPDKESQKLAIEAAKVIGADPEVGLNAPPQGTGIQINLNTLGNVLDKVEIIDIKKEE